MAGTRTPVGKLKDCACRKFEVGTTTDRRPGARGHHRDHRLPATDEAVLRPRA